MEQSGLMQVLFQALPEVIESYVLVHTADNGGVVL
jgi:hypothetical protein